MATIQTTLLGRDQVLLEYSLGEERSHLFVVTPGAAQTFELPPRQTIEKSARRVYELLAARNERPRFETASERRARIAAADRAFPVAAARLAKMILAPARQLIDGRRLIVVADGALRLVPFAALPDPRSPRQPLIESHEIAGVPSMSVLALVRRELRERAEPAGAVAVVADPLLPAQPRLPHVAEEARSILALVPANESKRALGADASRSLVMGGELANYRYIHFATHAAVDTSRPELSSIFLSSGALRADDVYNLRLPAEMVVLSACRTGLGKDLRSEGVLGLERAFLHAGAARVVVSLWSVSDRATASLMTELYRSILGGARLTPAAALRAAQRATRRHEGWSAPYFWAGFTMEGEPD